MTLAAIVMAVWTTLAAGQPLSKDATDAADAIEKAVLGDGRPAIGGSKEFEAALEAVYAKEESGVQRRPKPMSWDARAGISCGMWQMPCQIVKNLDLWGQAKFWLYMMRMALAACPPWTHGAMMCGSCYAGAPQRMANFRWRTAAAALRKVTATASSQP